VPTSGHTSSHFSVIVKDGDMQIVLAGDASYLETTMLRGIVDGISPDESVAKATLSLIRQLCMGHPTIYLPTHDPESGARLSQRRPSSVRRNGRLLLSGLVSRSNDLIGFSARR
jgi:glyoxylase-like metal-dependent hydrolase (beta-lactamase superfamily II)